MLRRVLLVIAIAVSPTLAYAGPTEASQAVFDRFLTAFTATDVDAVVGVFWPDAMFWGTTMPSLATTSEAMREYFKGVSKTWGSLLACLGLIGPSDA